MIIVHRSRTFGTAFRYGKVGLIYAPLFRLRIRHERLDRAFTDKLLETVLDGLGRGTA